MLSWAPGTNFDDVDYVMKETKGEGSWVILMDTGVTWQHQVSFFVNGRVP